MRVLFDSTFKLFALKINRDGACVLDHWVLRSILFDIRDAHP